MHMPLADMTMPARSSAYAGDEELLHSLLDMFAADESFLKLMSALDAHDALEAFTPRIR